MVVDLSKGFGISSKPLGRSYGQTMSVCPVSATQEFSISMMENFILFCASGTVNQLLSATKTVKCQIAQFLLIDFPFQKPAFPYPSQYLPEQINRLIYNNILCTHLVLLINQKNIYTFPNL